MKPAKITQLQPLVLIFSPPVHRMEILDLVNQMQSQGIFSECEDVIYAAVEHHSHLFTATVHIPRTPACHFEGLIHIYMEWDTGRDAGVIMGLIEYSYRSRFFALC